MSRWIVVGRKKSGSNPRTLSSHRTKIQANRSHARLKSKGYTAYIRKPTKKTAKRYSKKRGN